MAFLFLSTPRHDTLMGLACGSRAQHTVPLHSEHGPCRHDLRDSVSAAVSLSLLGVLLSVYIPASIAARTTITDALRQTG